MRRVNVIGIGAGDPEYMTVQALRAMKETDVFFVPNKDMDDEDLRGLRSEICGRYLDADRYRIVEIPDPQRVKSDSAYAHSVELWYESRARLWGRALTEEIREGQTAGFLVWGDPSLYDSTLRVLDTIRDKDALGLTVEVFPGISAAQALTARHKITLNQVGGSVVITTGRELAKGWPADASDVLVMLDTQCSFKDLDSEITIYWGAFLGTADEILISGTIGDCAKEVERTRAEARSKKGWMFDTYLLRRLRT